MRSGLIPTAPGQWVSDERLQEIKREVWQEAMERAEAFVSWYGVGEIRLPNPYAEVGNA